MESDNQEQGQRKQKATEIKTYPVPFALEEIKEHITISTNTPSKPSKEKLINLAIKVHLQGNISKAAEYYKDCINKGLNDYRVFSNYGVILQKIGKSQEAELSTRKAIELKPNFAMAHSNLGNILRELGNIQEAELSTRKAIELDPYLPMAHSSLGNILRDLGNLQEAELSIRKAIELDPNFADAYLNLGIILKGLNRPDESVHSYEKAIELNPNFADAYLNRGNILFDLGHLQKAELSIRKAIELKPDFKNAYFNLFRHYEQTNSLKKLKESLKEFENVDNIKNELCLFNARLSFRHKENKAAKELIDNISPQWIEKNNSVQNTIFWNYKAFIEDKLGNYDSAYYCFEKSQENSSYERLNKNLYLKFIDSYKESIIQKTKIIKKLNAKIEESNLVFLIGFPRSGTTLLDTILRSHPDIEVIEEQPLISSIEQLIKVNYNTKIENIYSISDNTKIILRRKYYELLRKVKNKKTKLIIDKLPLHTVSLPLINLLFPNAKIIFTHRHPYDTVLSCFQQTFKPNAAMANFISLQSSAKMYNQVMGAWDIYKNNLNLNFITSKYEHLIEDFDDHTLKILDFLGVGWDNNIKNYRKTAIERGKINTPSSSQVVQPLYKSSIEKWRNYEKYFKDCHQYLEKWVSYFAY